MATQSKGAQAAKPAPKEAVRTVQCTATRMGYYGTRRIREGQAVTITLRGDETLPTWVTPVAAKAVAAPAPEQETGGDGGSGDTGEPVI